MIVYDIPRCTGRYGMAAHLISTVSGDAGKAELLVFGNSVGLKRSWLQKAGKHDEHYDIMGEMLGRVKAAGAREVHIRELVGYLVAKRG